MDVHAAARLGTPGATARIEEEGDHVARNPGEGMSTSSRFLKCLSLEWVPVTTALVSLVLSVGSIFISTQEPAVVVILPEQLRVAQGEDVGFAYMYFQPAFVNTGRNDRVEVIRTMSLRVAPSRGGQVVEFFWAHQAELVYDRGTNQLNYRYVADAVPLVVSPRNAQVPFSVFNGPKGWYFAPGTYRMTLTAQRVVSSRPLEAAFEVNFPDKDVDFLNKSRGKSFLAFPVKKQ